MKNKIEGFKLGPLPLKSQELWQRDIVIGPQLFNVKLCVVNTEAPVSNKTREDS